MNEFGETGEFGESSEFGEFSEIGEIGELLTIPFLFKLATMITKDHHGGAAASAIRLPEPSASAPGPTPFIHKSTHPIIPFPSHAGLWTLDGRDEFPQNVRIAVFPSVPTPNGSPAFLWTAPITPNVTTASKTHSRQPSRFSLKLGRMTSDAVELSVVMPCLNEAETLGQCIAKAQTGIQHAGVRGEIVIADNGSTDGSQAIAEKLGARVVHVKEKGYGSALRGGIRAALGKWIVMGDADDSYDFSELDGFVGRLREGCELVMGCRLPSGGGKIMPDAMPLKNRWLGNPALSFIGRLFFRSPIRDFHCGLRGFTRTAFEKMDLQTTGMEFASEMVIKATLRQLNIAEVPITLYKDGRSRPPHLKPWRDGWRHLRFMLLYSPRWLFLVPGLLLSAVGLIISVALSLGNFHIGAVEFNVGTLAVACMMVVIGFQLVAFAFYTKVFAIAEGLLPDDPKLTRLFRVFTLEKGMVAGLAVLLAGAVLLGRAVWVWRQAGYGALSPQDNLRRLLPAATLVILGIQGIFASFFMSVLGLKTVSRRPPEEVEPPKQ